MNNFTNKDKFETSGYCVIEDAISPDLRDFITQYSLFDEMQNFKSGDQQVPNSHHKYADPCMETVLLNLQNLIELNTGYSLYPTYSYYRVYRPGDDLKPHKDRPSCEISATLCFNYSYVDTEYKWPIIMDGRNIVQSPGDMVIYKGCDLEHWRNEFDILDKDSWHVQGFFHYVDVNGPYADYKFDKRSSIGESKQSASTIDILKPYLTYK